MMKYAIEDKVGIFFCLLLSNILLEKMLRKEYKRIFLQKLYNQKFTYSWLQMDKNQNRS